ncbi:aminopeptidase N-like [Andrena cerasifolii]|uniref:aminopeptidase N-like n=1 Tax=Andrena cerasifolii TaxID=2819439 RepID=UPI004037636A
MAAFNMLLHLYVFVFASFLSLGTTDENIRKEAVNKYRLPDDTIPIHYNIKLDLHNSTFDGETEIYLKVRRSTSTVVLHSKNLTIDEVTTNIRKDNNTIKPKEHIYDDATEMLGLRFEDPLEAGVYILKFKFTGALADDLYGIFRSFYEDEEGNEVPIIMTHFQRTYARRAFPCWDEPALKATFNVSLKHYPDYTALSNMPAYMMEHDEKDGKNCTHFQTTPIMSTNILAFGVVDFPHVSNSNDTIRVWVRSGEINDTTYFMHVIEKATDELTRYLNSTVRVPKMDHVVIPDYSAGATENWGMIIYLEYAVPRNSDLTQIRMQKTMTVTHEIAHQWFGNLVSPAWWKYHWLSEGMSTYLKFYITDKMFETWTLMDNLVHTQILFFSTDDNADVTHVNRDFTTNQARRHSDYFTVYSKPAILFWMLSNMVGEDVFRAGLLSYINEHKYSNVTSNDLWEAMQSALNQSNTTGGNFQVKEVMDTWIEQTGYPLVTVTRNYTTGDITISQEPSPADTDKTQRKWCIPINYATASTPDFSATKPMRWLKQNDDKLVIQGVDVDDWIIVNLQHTGYFRVDYDSTNWEKIAQYLNTEHYNKIHPANRVQLLRTAVYLLSVKRLSPTIFLQLANYLRREVDPVVWNGALEIIDNVKHSYLKSPRGAAILSPMILRLMNNYMETINYDELLLKDGYPKLVTLNALNLACQLGHSTCQENAAIRLNAYISDPAANGIPSDAEYWILCMGLVNANRSTWDALFQLKMQNLHESLKFLSCAGDPDIIAHYLSLSLMTNASLSRFIEPSQVLLELNTDIPANIDAGLDFVTRNFDKIANLTDQAEGVLDKLIWKINRMDQLDKLKTFLRARGINKDSSIHYRKTALKAIEVEIDQISSWLTIAANQNITVTPLPQ